MELNILIVDDSTTMRSILKKIIRMTDVLVKNFYEAACGGEGIQVLKQNNVNLILLDINMPLMNGIEFAQKVKSDDFTSQIPIIFISSQGTNDHKEKAKELGIKTFIRKPFEPKEIKEAIEAYYGTV